MPKPVKITGQNTSSDNSSDDLNNTPAPTLTPAADKKLEKPKKPYNPNPRSRCGDNLDLPGPKTVF